MIIMLGHFEQTLAGDVPPPRHVFQKRKDIFLLFRTAEAYDQDRIVSLFLGSNIRQRSAVGVICLIHAYHLTRETMDEGIYSVARRPGISRADHGALPRRDRHGEIAWGLSERGKDAEECRPGMSPPDTACDRWWDGRGPRPTWLKVDCCVTVSRVASDVFDRVKHVCPNDRLATRSL